MKVLLILTVLSLLAISSFATKSYVVAAESGHGKSTLCSSLFGVDAPSGMYTSQTRDTTRYTATSRGAAVFQGCSIYDTPGTHDTTGVTNEEIMAEIEKFYLKEIDTNRDTTLDGFIFIVSTKETRIRLADLTKDFVSSFSNSVLKSMVIVINWFDSETSQKADEMRRRVEIQAAGMSDDAFGNEFVQIPVVIVNAKNPTGEQITDLNFALSKIQKYRLVDLEKKEQEVRQIFEDLKNDPDNLKELKDKIINEVEVEFQEQGFKKVPKEFNNEKVEGCKFSLNLGVASICIPNKVNEKVTLLVDEDVTLTKKEKRPVIEEKISQVLKNEESVIWKQAVDVYHKKLLDAIVKRQRNIDL